MKLMLLGLNYAPEEIGIGKYSGEMVQALVDSGWEVTVVTSPPYYPQWKVAEGFRKWWWGRDRVESDRVESSGKLEVIRCPLWVPRRVNGWKRVLHLLSFAMSSAVPALWKAWRKRPDVIMTVEPAAMCMPTTLMAARMIGAKAWLHVQDFEVDAAFELGILQGRWLRGLVSAVEVAFMRRFDRVSSISPNMVRKLFEKGVRPADVVEFPNWVDCHAMRPLPNPLSLRAQFGLPSDRCVVLYAGNIGAKQGLELVVEAARACTDPRLLFVICGNGAAYSATAELARDVPNVKLLPVQPFEAFNQLMNCADIHLLPQRADAADLVMPSKLTGMLATGRAVVACASAGSQIASVVEGRGIVVPPGDATAMLTAIELLSRNDALRDQYAASAREYAVSHLSADAILASFMLKLKELVASDQVQSELVSDDNKSWPEDATSSSDELCVVSQNGSETAEHQN